MALMDFVVTVSRYAEGVKKSKGSGYIPVLRIALLDQHTNAAKATFEELKTRFPAADGFKLELFKREEVTTQMGSHP